MACYEPGDVHHVSLSHDEPAKDGALGGCRAILARLWNIGAARPVK